MIGLVFIDCDMMNDATVCDPAVIDQFISMQSHPPQNSAPSPIAHLSSQAKVCFVFTLTLE